MAFNVNDFRAAFKFGGARHSKFEIKITNPINTIADSLLPFQARAASLPASTINPIEVFYFGRAIKVAGNRTFDDWQVQIYNDENFLIRNAMEQWQNAINLLEQNRRGLGTSEMAAYKSTAEVTQLSQTGQPLRTYKFSGLFPIVVGNIELDWQNEGVQEFPVTFAYDYYYVEGSQTGNAGGR